MARAKSELLQAYRRLLRYLKPRQWWIVAGAALASGGYAAGTYLVPDLMEGVFDRLQEPSGTVAYAVEIPLAILIVFALRGIVEFLLVYGLNWVGRSVIRDLRADLFRHYLGLPVPYYDRNSTGVLISRLTFNTEQVAEAVSNAIVVLFRDSLTIVGALAWMITRSPALTLLVVLVGPIIGLLVAAMGRAFRRFSTRIQNSMGDVTRVTEQSLQGQRIVKIFAGQEHERAQFEAINERNFRLNVRLVSARAVGDALTQYAVAAGVAACIFVASWILDEELSGGVFVGFLTALGILLAPLKRLINVNAVWQRGIAAAQDVFATLDEPLERDIGTEALERARGDVEYRKVSFGYDPAKGRVLKEVDLAVPAGTSVALVGHSGSGKSTLVGLLMRFYDVDAGSILLDGKDVRSYRLADLRRQVSLVSQDVVLFDDTIANNIAYGALAVRSRAEIERAAEAAYVTEFAADLPNGLDTRVGERGLLLSGGQRQRIAIARAILKDAPVLILDEATSSLDSESERRIQQALARLMQGRTTLIVAHRLSTVEKADRIVVLREGQIVETGAHERLLARGGYYATLYKMQFAD
jgi:subfamily B ATP-binding cassette protein MsbA